MNDQKAVTGYSAAETWEKSIELLLSSRDSPIVDTDTGGATIELESLLLEVLNPLAEPRVSDRFITPQLIDGYQGVFIAPGRHRPQDTLTIADRIYAWPTAGKNLDQVRRIVAELKSNPTSRRAIVQIWNPELDLPSTTSKGAPSGHCFFYFSIRNEVLNLTVSSRSVDAWNGSLPNILALTNLQQEVARRLKIPVGVFRQFIISYHI
ncbi:MAG: thymidylate synthase, partial [Gammaproteobacteria bacterium]